MFLFRSFSFALREKYEIPNCQVQDLESARD